LLHKHPEIAHLVPGWTERTFCGIVDWGARAGVETSAPAAQALGFLPVGGAPRQLPLVVGSRRLRILTYRWHVPHQYELWKLPVDITVATGCGSPMTEHWELGQRPHPRNASFARFEDIDPRQYDLAIVHFDENVLAPQNTNGVIGPDWGAAFRFFHDNVRLPTIAVCHGTPQFYGQYNFDYDKPDLMQTIEAERVRLVEYLREAHVVCNSYQAHAEWRFHRSSVIWHGFDPTEFPPGTHERGILSPLGPLVLSRPHYRGYFLYQKVFDGCRDELRPETLCVPEPHPAYTGNAYAVAKFRRYVDEIRRYSVYFNPTLRSPMPRARGEPMMCGVVTVNADNHDVSRFIEQGVDGFYSNDADELREQLRFLVRNPDSAIRMGAAARAKAVQVFHIERYLAQWSELIREVVR
jgi:hypothetical protein